jgi:hypothetical protein
MALVNDGTWMTAISAPASIPRSKNRSYIAVQAAGSDIVVTISKGTPFTITNGAWWGPQPAPTNDIVFTGTGTIITG